MYKYIHLQIYIYIKKIAQKINDFKTNNFKQIWGTLFFL